jgi:hypothetical protein
VNQIAILGGNSGYNSSSKLAGALGSETSAMVSQDNVTGGDLISYMGYADYLSATAGGGFALSYNGVPFSMQAIENGQYKLWDYEHIYIDPLASAAAQSIANLLATNIYNAAPATKNGLQITDTIQNMRVTRSGLDGSSIVPSYSY